MKTTEKSKFRAALIAQLQKDGVTINEKAIESALRKQKLAVDNIGTDGIEPWDIENQLDNAICFYHEFGEKNSYNRQTSLYRNR